MKPYVLPLSDPQASLDRVGGKGMSLAKLARAGLPVPDGFYITTTAYQDFVAASGLQAPILAALGPVDAADPVTFEAASQAIAALFAAAEVPAEVKRLIREAYNNLG